jgi:microsomal dipeptidase-like Zn-dependent dipeptidase
MGDWYSYDTRFIRGASSCVDLVNVAIAIGRLGFDRSELAGVLGGNFLRVFERIWEPDEVESHV